MRTKRIPKFMFAAALILSLGLMTSVSGCGSSTTTVFIPSQILAQFAVFSDSTESASGTTTGVYAGAIFWDGLFTKEVVGGRVEVVAQGGSPVQLNVAYNPAGAPYYIASLASFQLNQTYTFRVILEDGTVVENSIVTPANSLAITSPLQGDTMNLSDWLVVNWTGDNPGRNAAIVLRRASTSEFFSVVGAGRVQAADNGSFNGTPPPLPGTNVAKAMEVGDAGTTGTRYLTITRTTATGVNGFLASSFIQGSLIYALEVQIAP